MTDFLVKGQEILDTFVTSIKQFDSKSAEIKDLTMTMNQIKSDLKRKRDVESSADEPVSKQRTPTIISDVESSDEEMDVLMSGNADGPTENQKDQEFLDDINEFFVPEDQLNPPVQTVIAELALKSLRPTNLDPEKFKKLKTKYQRPANVESLQIPRIDAILWRQLKPATKNADHSKQKTIGHLNLVAGPLLQAMDHIYGNKQPDVKVVMKCVSDAFKLVGCSIATVNQQRRENIRKELTPKFKSICGDDTPVTALGLFGDNLTDQSKQLDSTKDIRMTANTTAFLGKGRGDGYKYNQNPSTHVKGQQNYQKQQWKQGQNQQQQNFHQKSGKGYNSFNKNKQNQKKH